MLGGVSSNYGTHLGSRHHGSPISMRVRHETFADGYRPVIARLLERASLLVAEVQEPTLIAAYLLFEAAPRPLIHYVYTRRELRRQGTASRLIEASGLDLSKVACTHLREENWTWLSRKLPYLSYDPTQPWRP